jgi:hypothetical protein
MDLPKFVFTVATQQLWFPKASTLQDDPYEGFCKAIHPQVLANDEGPKSVTHSDIHGTKQISVAQMSVEIAKFASTSFETAPEQLFVNCWCLEVESMAMSRIYGSLDFGVAIRSTVGQYRRALRWGEVRPEQYVFGRVQYHDDLESVAEIQHDFSQGFVPLSSNLWHRILEAAFHKRSCYRYESEWRAALYQHPNQDVKGAYIPFDVEELISAVHVSPRAEAFFVDAVRAVMEKFEITKPLERSTLLSPARRRASTA